MGFKREIGYRTRETGDNNLGQEAGRIGPKRSKAATNRVG